MTQLYKSPAEDFPPLAGGSTCNKQETGWLAVEAAPQKSLHTSPFFLPPIAKIFWKTVFCCVFNPRPPDPSLCFPCALDWWRPPTPCVNVGQAGSMCLGLRPGQSDVSWISSGWRAVRPAAPREAVGVDENILTPSTTPTRPPPPVSLSTLLSLVFRKAWLPV